MTDLPAALREELSSRFLLYSTRLDGEPLRDGAGTLKARLVLGDGEAVEAVLLRDEAGRGTACLSTQAGCPAGCVFCKTGSLGFTRNLSSGEIAEQYLRLRALAGGPDPAALSNVVIMGMGEPLLNLEALRGALEWLCGPEGMGVSRRRVTVSTCGIAAGILDLAERGPYPRLALSLTTAREPLREALMPIARGNPLPVLRESLLRYQERSGKRVTLEAALLGGVNTTPEDAAALARFVQGPPPLDAVINLIPWNPVPGLSFQGRPLRPPAKAEEAAFRKALEARGLSVTRRFRRGGGIAGACGQLGGRQAR